MGGINTRTPLSMRKKKKRHNPVCEKRRKKERKKLHISQLLYSLLFGIIFVLIFLNRDLDTALVSGGAAAEAGEEVGDVVLENLLVLNLGNGSVEKSLPKGDGRDQCAVSSGRGNGQ